MRDLYFIPTNLSVILTVISCIGVGLQAAVAAMCFIRVRTRMDMSYLVEESSLCIYLAVLCFILSAVQRQLFDGIVVLNSFDAALWITGVLTALMCIAEAVYQKKPLLLLLVVPALATMPCFYSIFGLAYKFVFNGVIIGLTLRAVLLMRWLTIEQSKSITRTSIKAALDTLPEGLMFARHSGAVFFQNETMLKLSHQMTETAVSDAVSFWNIIFRCEVPNVVYQARISDSIVLLRFYDGTSWEFSRMLINIGDRSVVRILATDVTEDDIMVQELERINDELEGSAKRLEYILENYSDIKTESEALKLKIKLHDEMGQRISLVSRAIADDTEESYSRIIPLLRDLTGGSLYADSHETQRLTLDDIVSSFALVGTRIIVSGELPDNEELSQVLLSVLREAATNAVRHAGANRISVDISVSSGAINMCVSNDGKKPPANYAEGGGISGMRHRIKPFNGKLTIKTEPEFSVNIQIPKE